MAVNDNLEAAARLFEGAAEELEQAARHCRTAARHMREREIPRAGAHAWAALGHLDGAEAQLREQARAHAQRSSP